MTKTLHLMTKREQYLDCLSGTTADVMNHMCGWLGMSLLDSFAVRRQLQPIPIGGPLVDHQWTTSIGGLWTPTPFARSADPITGIHARSGNPPDY